MSPMVVAKDVTDFATAEISVRFEGIGADRSRRGEFLFNLTPNGAFLTAVRRKSPREQSRTVDSSRKESDLGQVDSQQAYDDPPVQWFHGLRYRRGPRSRAYLEASGPARRPPGAGLGARRPVARPTAICILRFHG